MQVMYVHTTDASLYDITEGSVDNEWAGERTSHNDAGV